MSLLIKKKKVRFHRKVNTEFLKIFSEKKIGNIHYSVGSTLIVDVPLIRPVRLAAMRPTF